MPPVTSSSTSPTSSPTPAKPLAGFAYSRAVFEDLADQALAAARSLGAHDAAVEVSEGTGLSVSVRKGSLENVERNRDKSLGVTVYLGQRRGNASTSDFSPRAIAQTVQAAYDIARYTAEDPFAGLPDPDTLSPNAAHDAMDLDLFHPWQIDAGAAQALALQCESAALKTSRLITNSDGAGVSAQQSHFFSAHMRDNQPSFRGGYASSRHSLGASLIAGRGDAMQAGSWNTSMRDPADLADPARVGRYAAERALSRLQPRRIKTGNYPVLFEAPVASGLLGALAGAVSGGALYRKSTFLLGHLGKPVLAPHLSVLDDPFTLKGKGSSPFDQEGVRVQRRHLVQGGVLEGYFLSSYTARKLGLKTTGNCGGAHNLSLHSSRTKPSDDLLAMIKKLRRGLFVTDLMGQGVNMVTGDYSRGASGYWVEGGEIAYPVEEITIAGNLKDMLLNIAAVGADAYDSGSKRTGSILVPRMTVAGA